MRKLLPALLIFYSLLGIEPVFGQTPVFKSLNKVTFKENGTGIVSDINATVSGGADDVGITYSLSGSDATDFSINTGNGELSFVTSPDYDVPHDSDSDNIYEINVTATAGMQSADTILQVLVTSVVEHILGDAIQLGADIPGIATMTDSGGSVTISDDGTTMTFSSIGTNSTDIIKIYRFIAGSWTQIGADFVTGDDDGHEVSLSADGNVLAIGGRSEGLNGEVDVFQYNGMTWSQLGSTISGESSSDFFGNAINLSSDGKSLVVGATLNDGNGSNSGSVRIFHLDDTNNWVQIGSDIDGSVANELFGGSVEISSNGYRIAVGARFSDLAGVNAGIVKVYDYNGSDWIQLGFSIVGEAADDRAGASISLNATGDILAVGATNNDGGGDNSGHVRIYQYNGFSWVQMGTDINGAEAGDTFGVSCELSADGQLIAIGANGNDDGGDASGHVRIFQYNGSAWVQKGISIAGEAASDFSGIGLSLSADGTIVAIGAPGSNENGADAGHVRVFDIKAIPDFNLPPSASYQEFDTELVVDINASLGTGADDANIFYSISGTDAAEFTIDAVSGELSFLTTPDFDGPADSDGDNIYNIEISGTNSTDTTTITYDVFVFQRVESLLGTGNLIGTAIQGPAGDFLGASVSMSADGQLFAVSSLPNDDAGTNRGQTKVYQLQGGNWVQYGQSINGESDNDFSGTSISLSRDGTTLAIGAKDNDGNATNAGHVRVYRFSAGVWIQLGSDLDGETIDDEFGRSVSLNATGDILVVGAWKYGTSNVGRTYVYQYNGSSWGLLGDAIPGIENDELSGNTVSLNSDGSTVAVAAFGNSEEGSDAGQLRIYTFIDGVWTQLGDGINGEAAFDNFGNSLSLSGNGRIVAAGAEFNNALGTSTGHARVFAFDGTDWIQLGTDIDGVATLNNAGTAVDLSLDGTVIAVSSRGNSDNGDRSGHVRMFRYNGNDWKQQGNPLFGENDLDFFGFALSMSADGETVAITSPQNDNNGANSGQVRVYDLTTTLHTWQGGFPGAENDWNEPANWSGGIIPQSTTLDILIPDTPNDPVVNDFISLVRDITVEDEALVTVNSGAGFQIGGNLTMNGNAAFTIKRNTRDNLGYSTIGSPITNATVADLNANLAYSYDEITNSFVTASGMMLPGEGIFAAFNSPDASVSFTGTPNTGLISTKLSMQGTGENGVDDGFNLIANPFMAPIFRGFMMTINDTGNDGSIWVWNDGATNTGSVRSGDYISVNDMGVVNNVSGGNFDENTLIGSMQGFFVRATVDNADFFFSPGTQSAIQGHNSDDTYFKGSDQKVQNRDILKLSLSGTGKNQDLYNELIIGLDNEATLGEDHSLDALKFSGNDFISFYSLQEEKQFAIQALPKVETSELNVSLGFYLALEGDYLINVEELQLENHGLITFLTDKLTNKVYDLSLQTKIPFSSKSAGEVNDRFSVTFRPSQITVVEENLPDNLDLKGIITSLEIQYANVTNDVQVIGLDGKSYFNKNVTFENGQATIDFRSEVGKVYILRVGEDTLKFVFH